MSEMATASLPELASRIRAEHRGCEGAARRLLSHALEAGRLLTEAKALLSHGEWGPWLSEQCDISARAARDYMRLHARRGELVAENGSAAVLSQREALRLLAAPPPEDVTAESAAAECAEFEREAAALMCEVHMISLAVVSADATLEDLAAADSRLLEIINRLVYRRLLFQRKMGEAIVGLKAETGLSEGDVRALIDMPGYLTEREQAEFWDGIIARVEARESAQT